MFRSLKARELLAVLRNGLGYEVDRQRGSHRWLKSRHGYPPFCLSFHSEGDTFPAGAVKKILTKDVKLSEQDALAILEGER